MAAPIRNIVFDLGGVLIDWNPKYVYRTIFDSEEKVAWFLNNICTSDWNARQDAGRPLVEATRTLQEKYPDWADEIEAYYGRWEEMLGGPIEATVDILEEINAKNRFNLFALTNWSHETFPVAWSRYAFLRLFQGIVVSGKEKQIKPGRAIYRTLLDRYNLEPSECLFIDDSKANVVTALEMGIQALWFESAEQLRTQLSELEIT